MDVYVSYGLGLSQLVILGDVTRLLIYSFGSTCSPNSSTVRTGLDARLAPRAAGDDGHAGLLDVVGACN